MSDVNKMLVLSDYSHTDIKKLQRVVTRPIHDQVSASIYAEIECDRLKSVRNRRGAKRRVYVVQIVEVHEVD